MGHGIAQVFAQAGASTGPVLIGEMFGHVWPPLVDQLNIGPPRTYFKPCVTPRGCL
ncbi:MAG: hypothetical protein VX992_04175, partial [Acidobacteriota bacterium]|nr:hypothetical protein [Acidobacteriota bacterium]